MDMADVTLLFDHILVPHLTQYLVGILGLLLVWQYHQALVLKGRIYAIDFWDFSGVRMFLHVSLQDGRACSVCRGSHGTLFLPSLATKRRLSVLPRPCSSPLGCRCLVLGLYGGWPEANRILQLLRRQARETPLQLTREHLLELIDTSSSQSVEVGGDRLTMQLLQGLHLEAKNPEWAIGRYRTVIEEAKGAKDLRLVVPAFLRLAEVVAQAQGADVALQVINQFEKRFAHQRKVFYYPSLEQRRAMADRKFRLKANVAQEGRLRM